MAGNSFVPPTPSLGTGRRELRCGPRAETMRAGGPSGECPGRASAGAPSSLGPALASGRWHRPGRRRRRTPNRAYT
eukprot:14815953-Alexandrium_andersonii.AAC.1